MNKRTGAALFLAVAVLFLILNRAAYKSYFQDDELDNIGWAPYVSAAEWAKGFLKPTLDPNNFRPTGHLYFAIMVRAARLDFPKYVLPLHLIHLVNVLLIYFVARKLKLGPLHACAGALFFALNMAVFDVFWKPMYVFDLLCGTLCLCTLLLYMSGQWIGGLITFWLAYKAKEIAVMLPAVLLLYELWFGQRRWRRLLPFFAISLLFGLQGVFLNPNKNNPYTFRFNFESLGTTIPFYSSRLFLLPYSGLALLVLPLIVRDRRLWFGVAAACLFFFPLLFLPGRMFPAYCYVPLIGVSIALGAAFTAIHPAVVVVLFALWIPWNIRELRLDRRATLAAADEDRTFVRSLFEYAKQHPRPPALVYSSVPLGYHEWGITAAWNLAYARGGLTANYIDTPEAKADLRRPEVALVTWDSPHRKAIFATRERDTPMRAYIAMNASTPLWQLQEGWFDLEGAYRWIKTHAVAALHFPPGAISFELRVNVPQPLIEQNHHSTIKVSLNGAAIGSEDFVAAGAPSVQWILPETMPRDREVRVEFDVSPEFIYRNDPRHLGIAIMSFGFLPAEGK